MTNLFTNPSDGFNIGNLEIKFYGLIMATAMLVGIFLAIKLAKKKSIKSDDIILLSLIILPSAVIGARLYYCFFYEYEYSFTEIIKIWQGGLAIYGGVIGGFIGIMIFCAIKKDIKILGVICDICVPCLILGQALGRWGNFFNQEAYGNLITNDNLKWFPFAVFIDSKNAWYQATFFYESLWNFIGLGLLIFAYYKSRFNWTTTGVYLAWYGLGRVWIEGLRSDSLFIGNSNIRVSQLLSAFLILIGIGILVYNHIRKRKLTVEKPIEKVIKSDKDN